MNVTRKDATITNTGPEDAFPGTFEVVLSTSAKDRDGDELDPEDWKQPLPEHITFDTDHGMSVATTVGSGTPSIEDGKMIVRGSYSSLPRAQEVRTLVNEKHIRTTSVAFMSEKVTKDGKTKTVRELLNGAFVAIPSNREAVVLSSKSGARNSRTDQAHIQAAHDSLVAAGADCGPMDSSGAEVGTAGGKSYEATLKAKYSAEQLRTMLSNGQAYKNDQGEPSYPIGDKEDLANAIHAVGRGGSDHDSLRAYIIRRAKALGASDQIPDNWNSDGSLKKSYASRDALVAAATTLGITREQAQNLAAQYFKTYTPDPDADPGALAQAVDAALDQVDALLTGVDVTALPEPVQQALGLVTAAEEAVDELLDALGVTDPDETDEESAPAAAGKAAPAAETDDVLALKNRLTAITAAALAG